MYMCKPYVNVRNHPPPLVPRLILYPSVDYFTASCNHMMFCSVRHPLSQSCICHDFLPDVSLASIHATLGSIFLKDTREIHAWQIKSIMCFDTLNQPQDSHAACMQKQPALCITSASSCDCLCTSHFDFVFEPGTIQTFAD